MRVDEPWANCESVKMALEDKFNEISDWEIEQDEITNSDQSQFEKITSMLTKQKIYNLWEISSLTAVKT